MTRALIGNLLDHLQSPADDCCNRYHRMPTLHGLQGETPLMAPSDELNPGPVTPTMTGLSASQRNKVARSSAILRASSLAFAFARASTYPTWQTPPGPSRVTTRTLPLVASPAD